MLSDQNQSESGSKRIAAGIVTFVCRSLASTVEVFLHRSDTFGERYLGLQAVAAIPLILLYAGVRPDADLRPLLVFLAAYIVALIIARIRGLVRSRRGEPAVHSYYTGTPRLMRIAGRLGERNIKRFVEPALVFITGVLTLPLHEPLGGFFIIASMTLFGIVNAAGAFDRARALNMHDAFIDQSNVSEQFRDMRGQ